MYGVCVCVCSRLSLCVCVRALAQARVHVCKEEKGKREENDNLFLPPLHAVQA